jgi:hypothetical protein
MHNLWGMGRAWRHLLPVFQAYSKNCPAKTLRETQNISSLQNALTSIYIDCNNFVLFFIECRQE